MVHGRLAVLVALWPGLVVVQPPNLHFATTIRAGEVRTFRSKPVPAEAAVEPMRVVVDGRRLAVTGGNDVAWAGTAGVVVRERWEQRVGPLSVEVIGVRGTHRVSVVAPWE